MKRSAARSSSSTPSSAPARARAIEGHARGGDDPRSRCPRPPLAASPDRGRPPHRRRCRHRRRRPALRRRRPHGYLPVVQDRPPRPPRRAVHRPRRGRRHRHPRISPWHGGRRHGTHDRPLGAGPAARPASGCPQGYIRQCPRGRWLPAIHRRRLPRFHGRSAHRRRHRNPCLLARDLSDPRLQAHRDHIRAARRHGRRAQRPRCGRRPASAGVA